ncbi:MAG: ATP-grasp domain-containing protein [Desulfobacteraceae bacterium]|nr:ATP-grasp domain-containing protein [Desulfobacteraceae bacterium]MBC2753605.1 ATP-grasp domain-containing protein [Desulfobacteraceae bacterium]
MNVVYLSPHFPYHYHQFCRQLKEAGANVLGIGDAPVHQLASEVRESLTEYYHVADMHDDDALVRACGYFTHRYGKLDRLESLNEYWLSTEARLRDDFNIFGIRGHQIDTIRKKSKMKAAFRAAGVPVARGAVVQNVEDARRLIAETGYPVVAKPDAGVGALDTYRLDNENDLTHFFAHKTDVDYIMEEFVAGTIYSFDGLADMNGDLVFFTSHCFSQGIMETVNEGRHIYYTSLREIPPTLEKLGRKCVEAFEVRERFFHIEFFRTADDRYVGLEINMRPPGGFTTDMFNYASDIDIYRIWAQLLVNGKKELDFSRKYHCCYASRKNGLPYRYSHDDILSRYGDQIVQVVQVPGVFASALGDIGYIYRSPDLDAIERIARSIHAPDDGED